MVRHSSDAVRHLLVKHWYLAVGRAMQISEPNVLPFCGGAEGDVRQERLVMGPFRADGGIDQTAWMLQTRRALFGRLSFQGEHALLIAVCALWVGGRQGRARRSDHPSVRVNRVVAENGLLVHEEH